MPCRTIILVRTTPSQQSYDLKRARQRAQTVNEVQKRVTIDVKAYELNVFIFIVVIVDQHNIRIFSLAVVSHQGMCPREL